MLLQIYKEISFNKKANSRDIARQFRLIDTFKFPYDEMARRNPKLMYLAFQREPYILLLSKGQKTVVH